MWTKVVYEAVVPPSVGSMYDRRAELNSGRRLHADKTWVRSLAPSQEASAPPFPLSLPLSAMTISPI